MNQPSEILTPKFSKNLLLPWGLTPGILFFSILLLQSLAASGSVYTVGVGCQYNDLQQAIDAIALTPRPRLLKVSRNMTHHGVHLVIQDFSLTIEGGYEGCGVSEPGSFRTQLFGNGSQSVVQITSGTSQQVTLKNLFLTGGGNGGAGINVSGETQLNLDSIIIDDNDAGNYLGGGIQAYGADVSVDIQDSWIGHNDSSHGGGIYCNGGRLNLANTTLQSNEATMLGGGILAWDCEVEITGQSDILYNLAGSGGGIAGDAGASIRILGTASNPILIQHNEAVFQDNGTRFGGGIYLVGIDTTFEGRNVQLDRNWVGNGGGCGGGLAVRYEATASLESSGECGPQGPCSSLSFNRGTQGAAACVDGGSEDTFLVINTTRIEGNLGPQGQDYSLNTLHTMEGGSLQVEGAVLTANRAVSLVQVTGSAFATLGFITASENATSMAEFLRVEEDNGEVGAAALFSSIVWELPGTDVLNADPGATVVAECLLAREANGFPPLDHLLTDSLPGFVDVGSGNFHLGANSAAIDFCDISPYTPFAHDIDMGFRGIDDAFVSDNFPGAIYDIGADEAGSNSFIFSDGFESGDLLYWSSSSP